MTFERHAGHDTGVDVEPPLVAVKQRTPRKPLAVRLRYIDRTGDAVAREGREAAGLDPEFLQLGTFQGAEEHVFMIAAQAQHCVRHRHFEFDEELHHGTAVVAAIDVIAEEDEAERPLPRMVNAGLDQVARLVVAAVDIADDVGIKGHHASLRDRVVTVIRPQPDLRMTRLYVNFAPVADMCWQPLALERAAGV